MKFISLFLSLLLMVSLSAHDASAESFSEKFRRFVLGPEAEAYSVGHQSARLDRVAEECLSCHNGSRASHVKVKNAQSPMQIRGAQTVNHPVGMSYDKYVMNYPRGYKSRATIDSNVRFVDGKVTCISCHRLKQEESGGFVTAKAPSIREDRCQASSALTMEGRVTDLCMACHIK